MRLYRCVVVMLHERVNDYITLPARHDEDDDDDLYKNGFGVK